MSKPANLEWLFTFENDREDWDCPEQKTQEVWVDEDNFDKAKELALEEVSKHSLYTWTLKSASVDFEN